MGNTNINTINNHNHNSHKRKGGVRRVPAVPVLTPKLFFDTRENNAISLSLSLSLPFCLVFLRLEPQQSVPLLLEALNRRLIQASLAVPTYVVSRRLVHAAVPFHADEWVQPTVREPAVHSPTTDTPVPFVVFCSPFSLSVCVSTYPLLQQQRETLPGAAAIAAPVLPATITETAFLPVLRPFLFSHLSLPFRKGLTQKMLTAAAAHPL